YRLNRRRIPLRRSRNRPHLLCGQHPDAHTKRLVVLSQLCKRLAKAQISPKKLQDLAAPRPLVCTKTVNVSLRQTRKPRPLAPKDSVTALANLVCVWLARNHGIRQHLQYNAIGHCEWRQSTPTSPTLRDPFRACARRRSRDECSVLHVALG